MNQNRCWCIHHLLIEILYFLYYYHFMIKFKRLTGIVCIIFFVIYKIKFSTSGCCNRFVIMKFIGLLVFFFCASNLHEFDSNQFGCHIACKQINASKFLRVLFKCVLKKYSKCNYSTCLTWIIMQFFRNDFLLGEQ